MTPGTPNDAEQEFWHLTAGHLDRTGITRSTMMGFPCLRLDGDFYASWNPKDGALVAKLDEATVTGLIAGGTGTAFAPNGRRFRQWISVPPDQLDAWPHILELAYTHARQRSGPALNPGAN